MTRDKKMPKPSNPVMENKNECVFPRELERIFSSLEELNFLCRANKKTKNGFSVDRSKIIKSCDDIIYQLEELRDGEERHSEL